MLKKCITYSLCRITRFCGRNGGFGMNELLGIAAALILAGFIIIPGLKDFADNVMNGLGDWWKDTVASRIFSAPPG